MSGDDASSSSSSSSSNSSESSGEKQKRLKLEKKAKKAAKKAKKALKKVKKLAKKLKRKRGDSISSSDGGSGDEGAAKKKKKSVEVDNSAELNDLLGDDDAVDARAAAPMDEEVDDEVNDKHEDKAAASDEEPSRSSERRGPEKKKEENFWHGKDEEGAAALTEEQEKAVLELLEERRECRKKRDYVTADKIRAKLLQEMRVDEDRGEWWCVKGPRGRGTAKYVEEQPKKDTRDPSKVAAARRKEALEAMRRATNPGEDKPLVVAKRKNEDAPPKKQPVAGPPANFAEERRSRLEKAKARQAELAEQMKRELPKEAAKAKAVVAEKVAPRFVTIKASSAVTTPVVELPSKRRSSASTNDEEAPVEEMFVMAEEQAPVEEVLLSALKEPVEESPSPKKKQKEKSVATTPVAAVSTPVAAASTPVAAASTPVAAVSTPAAAASSSGESLTPANVKAMTVKKLRDALEARDLDTKGLKAALATRLLEAL